MSEKDLVVESVKGGYVIGRPAEPATSYDKGIGSVLFEKMLQGKNSIVQIDGVTGQTDTYRTFLQRCVRTAIAMRARGLERNDIVTVCSTNHLNTCVPILASYFLGVVPANTDVSLSLSDTVQLLDEVRPKMIFVSPEAVELIEDALRETGVVAEIVVFGRSAAHANFDDFAAESPDEETFRPTDADSVKETALIYFSSGSTGLPKGICLSHLSVLGQIRKSFSLSDVPNAVLFTSSTAYWSSFMFVTVNAIFYNNAYVFVPSFRYHDLWRLIRKYTITMILLTPTQLTMLAEDGRPKDADTSSLALICLGGSVVGREHVEKLKKCFPDTAVTVSYGLTEISGLAASFNAYDATDVELSRRKLTSVGRPLPGFTIKVVDPETDEILGENRSGELRIKSNFQMNGYFNKNSDDQWDADGYLKTGDIGYYDEDFCFYIVGRIKEMMKFQGWQIAPIVLENILLSHPAVSRAVVVGLPHPVDCEHPMGVVVLKGSHADRVSAAELEKFVETKVDDRKRLRGGVKIVNDIPMTPSSKVKRWLLKDMAVNGEI